MPDIFVATDNKKDNPQKKEVSSNSQKHLHLLSSFCLDPKGIRFADQEKDEKILLFLRRHPITNVDWILLAVFFALVPVFFSYIINAFNIDFLLNIPGRFTLFFLIFYYSAVFTFMLVNFMSWFYNVGLITERRVVDIDFVELIYKHISTTKFELIQDVNYIQHGAIRAIFHFGDVIVQTAGQEGNFELEAVPHPDKVTHLIEDFIGKKKPEAHES